MDNTPIAPTATKKNHKGLKITGIVLIFLALIGTMAYCIYLYQQNTSLRNDLSANTQEKEVLAANNSKLTKEISDNKKVEEPVISDEDAVKQAAQLYLDAQKLDTTYIPSTVHIEDIFASVSVSPASMPTYIPAGLYLKKVRGEWIVIWNGQNGPDKTTGEKFELPKDWYDSTS